MPDSDTCHMANPDVSLTLEANIEDIFILSHYSDRDMLGSIRKPIYSLYWGIHISVMEPTRTSLALRKATSVCNVPISFSESAYSHCFQNNLQIAIR